MTRTKSPKAARAANAVPALAVENLEADLCAARDEIARRAYELFESRGLAERRELDDWLCAERELFWEPQATITERGDAYLIEIAMPGAKPEDLEVRVTGNDVLVKSTRCIKRHGDGEKRCMDELPQGKAFRLFEFPARLDSAKATAELRDGLLRVSVPVCPAEPGRVVPVAA